MSGQRKKAKATRANSAYFHARSMSALRSARRRDFEIVEFVKMQLLIDRDGMRCHWCQCKMTLADPDSPAYATFEHLKPVHSYADIVLACIECNKGREDAVPFIERCWRSALLEDQKREARRLQNGS